MVFEIVGTTWRRSGQSLAIEYRGEYGSQPQVLIVDAKQILRMWFVWLASEDAAEHPLHSDDGDSLVESELSNDELDPLFDIT